MFLLLSPSTFFRPPPFSIFLSLSISSSSPVFVLPVFLFCFLLLPCFCLFLSFSFFSAFVSWKEQHQKDWCTKVFFINLFFFFGFLSSFLFEIPFSSLCFFADLKLCFCSTSLFLVSKKPKLKNTNFWSKGELQQNGFLWPCVLQSLKSYRFLGGHFLTNFGWCSKNTIKKVFQHFLKKQKMEKMTIFKVNNWAKLKSIIGPSWGSKKKANLAQLLTLKICVRFLFHFQKFAETPIFIGFFWHNLLKKQLGPIIDFANPQTWPNYWLHSIYIYIYIYHQCTGRGILAHRDWVRKERGIYIYIEIYR